MNPERELLKGVMSHFAAGEVAVNNASIGDLAETLYKIQELLAQPEQTEPVEICPDCGSKVTWYHCREGTRVVCRDKCQGYKVIASRGRRDECFTKGDL